MENHLPIVIKLAEEYYQLEAGVFIEKPTEMLLIACVKNSKHEKHPHPDHTVCISRKAIKHFIERRKDDLSKNHSDKEALERIYYVLTEISEAIINFDRYELEVTPEKHFYIKHYPGNPSLCIICERINDRLEICSMHLRKQQKNK